MSIYFCKNRLLKVPSGEKYHFVNFHSKMFSIHVYLFIVTMCKLSVKLRGAGEIPEPTAMAVYYLPSSQGSSKTPSKHSHSMFFIHTCYFCSIICHKITELKTLC